MARSSAFLGRQVEVQYRAGDILLPASGTFVGDTGRSVFLEQCFEQNGQHKQFRWEIPYQCIVRLVKKTEPVPGPSRSSAADGPRLAEPDELATLDNQPGAGAQSVSSNSTAVESKVALIFPRPQRS
jgi:hypothetical protein